jgi:serine protease Do
MRLLLTLVGYLAIGSCFGATKAVAQTLPIVAKAERGKVVQVVVQAGQTVSVGSGVWVSEDGYVATCFHVVSTASSPKIVVRSSIDSLIDLEHGNIIDANWQVFDASIVVKDEKNDVAILKVVPNPFKTRLTAPIKLGDTILTAHFEKGEVEEKLPVAGENILIGGYPLGLPYEVFQEGSVASIAVIQGVPKVFLSAVANHGNSGGPVFNDRGEVIGLLEGEVPGADRERTGLEIVVPAYYVTKLLREASQQVQSAPEPAANPALALPTPTQPHE